MQTAMDKSERWFPRPRGDGPCDWPARCESRPVSPPTRGWTHLRQHHGQAQRGFPAHAGMDPSGDTYTFPVGGFPRPRGDGPAGARRLFAHGGVSPPTRGWTCSGQDNAVREGGFPAHAGMDPQETYTEAAFVGFPRPRGDGPPRRTMGHGPWSVSPPTRGWTSRDGSSSCRVPGFPAHAGMDRRAVPGDRCDAGFPRPRGDGPHATCAVPGAGGGGSPPTRGWTQRISHAGADAKGFPAHAGMDLSRRQDRSAGSWFPRPRGDGPFWCAGPFSSPRVSPPTRGWTAECRRARCCRPGFPAHAGMDLQSTSRRKSWWRFPRPLSMALENCAFLATENCALSGDGSRGPA